jgi:hypothetical protein
MGEDLMNGSDPRAKQLDITDRKVCRSYLVGNCPHDLFTNTKQDFGPCPNVHSEALKQEYQDATPEQKREWAFEWDYYRDMQGKVEECNRRIEQAQRRLEKTPDEIMQTNRYASMRHPANGLPLTVHSSSKSTTTPKPSKPASLRSRLWARKARSIRP